MRALDENERLVLAEIARGERPMGGNGCDVEAWRLNAHNLEALGLVADGSVTGAGLALALQGG